MFSFILFSKIIAFINELSLILPGEFERCWYERPILTTGYSIVSPYY